MSADRPTADDGAGTRISAAVGAAHAASGMRFPLHLALSRHPSATKQRSPAGRDGPARTGQHWQAEDAGAPGKGADRRCPAAAPQALACGGGWQRGARRFGVGIPTRGAVRALGDQSGLSPSFSLSLFLSLSLSWPPAAVLSRCGDGQRGQERGRRVLSQLAGNWLASP